MNIFQIWDSIGRVVPFAVRRDNWGEQYYTVVEKIECFELPYGKAYGYPTVNGKYSTHYEYDKKWRNQKLIPSAGSYQWALVEGADLTSYREGIKAAVSSIKGAYTLASSFYFGKFESSTVAEAFNEQPSYIQWLILNHGQFFLEPATLDYLHTLRPDFKFSIECIKANNDKVDKRLDKSIEKAKSDT